MAQCIVIGPVCGFVTAGGRAGGVRTLLQPARAVFASLCALFSFLFYFRNYSALRSEETWGLRLTEVGVWPSLCLTSCGIMSIRFYCKYRQTLSPSTSWKYRKLGININYTLLCTIKSLTKYRTRTAISRQTSDSSLHATESYLIKTVIAQLTMACLHTKLYSPFKAAQLYNTHTHIHTWNLTRPKEGCRSGFLKAYVFLGF